MSVELVTGYYGVGEDGEPNRHVSSAEDGARQAGTLGLGCYALSTGSKLSATMEDANTLVVAGALCVLPVFALLDPQVRGLRAGRPTSAS